MSEVLAQVENLHVSRNGRKILEDISVSFSTGRMTAVLGPNGAGKSSLVRVLSGDWPVEAGKVQLFQKPLHQWDALELARRRAVLPQESQVRFPFTVREIITLGRLPYASVAQASQDEEVVNRLMQELDVAGLENRPYIMLSGGEKQRVQLARILAQIAPPWEDGPPLLILDEPMNNLDPSHQFALLDRVAKISHEGAAVIIVLHDLNLAARYADEILLIMDGKVIAHDSTGEVLTPETIEAVFSVRASVYPDSETGGISVALAPPPPQKMKE